MDDARDMLLRGAERLVDRAASLADLEHHRLQLLAARRWRALGRPLPERLVLHERLAAAAALAAPALLARLRDASDEPLLLVKGPEVARSYPDPALRSFRDLDVIVPDAERTQRRLLAAGFVPMGEPELYVEIHHLRPLCWPGLPLVVEVHHAPKWIDGLAPPSARELLDAALPGGGGVDGILALPPAQHALLLAAHAWAHRPLAHVRDLLDVALVARAADPAELERLARDWGLRRVWRTTRRAAHALLGDGPRPASLAVWARHLEDVREPTVLESHLERWLGGPSALPGARAPLAALAAVGSDLVPGHGEPWPVKLARTRAALGNAFTRKSQHDRALTASSKGGQ